MKYQFECLDNGRWYVVMPEYEGDHADLEMVENADNMCAALSDDGLFVTLEFSDEPLSLPDSFTLEMEAHDDDGAFYNVVGCDRFSGTIWLCNVTHEVFDDHPERIYCAVVE